MWYWNSNLGPCACFLSGIRRNLKRALEDGDWIESSPCIVIPGHGSFQNKESRLGPGKAVNNHCVCVSVYVVYACMFLHAHTCMFLHAHTCVCLPFHREVPELRMSSGLSSQKCRNVTLQFRKPGNFNISSTCFGVK